MVELFFVRAGKAGFLGFSLSLHSRETAQHAPERMDFDCNYKGGPSRSCIAGLGAREVNREDSVRGSLKVAKEDFPKPVHPQQRIAEASARVARFEPVLQLLGEDDPDAEFLKVALSSASSGGAFRSLPQARRMREKTSGHEPEKFIHKWKRSWSMG